MSAFNIAFGAKPTLPLQCEMSAYEIAESETVIKPH